MRCPYCGELENKVIDSRMAKEGDTVRRRRQCLSCDTRFTTYERVEQLPLVLIKKDNRREPFNREKILMGMQRACEKRDISIHTLERFVDELEREFQELGEREIPSSMIGERVMRKLHELDDVPTCGLPPFTESSRTSMISCRNSRTCLSAVAPMPPRRSSTDGGAYPDTAVLPSQFPRPASFPGPTFRSPPVLELDGCWGSTRASSEGTYAPYDG